jgi:hypothetical protein
MSPTVSVIIPNYNHARFLPERIESILRQEFKDFELLILDDASTDNSLEIIQSYANKDKRIKLITNAKNSGSPFRQWKKGLDHATGKYVWIAESDDFSDVWFLEIMIAAIEMDENCEVGYCLSQFVDDYGDRIGDHLENLSALNPTLWKKNFYLPGRQINGQYMPIINVIPNAGAVLFKRTLTEGMPWETLFSFKLAGDRFFWVQILKTTRLAYVAHPMNFFRMHQNTVRQKHAPTVDYLKEIIRVNAAISSIENPTLKTKKAAIRQWLRSAKKVAKPIGLKTILVVPQISILIVYFFFLLFIRYQFSSRQR